MYIVSVSVSMIEGIELEKYLMLFRPVASLLAWIKINVSVTLSFSVNLTNLPESK